MRFKETIKKHFLDASYGPLVLTAIVTVFVVYLVFYQTQTILKERLRQRLIAIAATAALQFDAKDVSKLRDENDLGRKEAKRIVDTMKAIREHNDDLKFIYILRPTDQTNTMEFVADADMLGSLEELDENQNGVLDEEEMPPVPGEPYDVSEIPRVLDALQRASADDELNTDKWGTFLSGYAPIKDDAGETKAVLGIDVRVDDFYALIRATFVPFVLLTALLLLLLTLQTKVLIRIWRSRVDLVKEIDRQKDELLSIVSHQLAAPVTSIKFYLEMLLDGDLGVLKHEQQESMKSMQSITADLSDLVSMILDVSRIQFGRMKLDRRDIDLSVFFKEILDVIEPRTKEKGIHFQVSMPKKLPTAHLDKRLTRMTIENLLTNAVKFTPEKGNVDLVVEIRGKSISCEVRDTGCGIPQSEQSQIFDKLFRASNVRDKISGNGFGLYIAKGAIESQGGKIWFQSEEGKGTQFFVELPL